MPKNKMKWPNNKRWVYSITYDEGLQNLLKYVLPLHRQYQLPGHVCVVAKEIGKVRNCRGSDYNGLRVLSKKEINALAGEGWGVSNHSMTHSRIKPANARSEVIDSKKIIEDLLGIPITLFCVPRNHRSYRPAVRVAKKAGYCGIMTIIDGVNSDPISLMKLFRCPLISRGPEPFLSAFDPFHRIQQMRMVGGWLIDYCHCPMPEAPINEAKDCTTEQLEARFRAVTEIGENDVWLAEPNEVVKHIRESKK